MNPRGTSMSHGMMCTAPVSVYRMLLTRPNSLLKTHLNMKPINTGANIIGIIMIVRRVPRPRIARAINCAMPRPIRNSRLTASAMNNTVRPNACQKIGSLNSVTYCVRPTKRKLRALVNV